MLSYSTFRNLQRYFYSWKLAKNCQFLLTILTILNIVIFSEVATHRFSLSLCTFLPKNRGPGHVDLLVQTGSVITSSLKWRLQKLERSAKQTCVFFGTIEHADFWSALHLKARSFVSHKFNLTAVPYSSISHAVW